MPIIIVLVLVVVAVVWFDRSREIFCLRLKKGRLFLIRGTISSGLHGSLQEALDGEQKGRIRAYRTPYGAKLSVGGEIGERTEQRLRNVLGLYPAAQLSAQAVYKRQVVGDIFTLAWLLSFFRR